jgi:hypothetical protein
MRVGQENLDINDSPLPDSKASKNDIVLVPGVHTPTDIWYHFEIGTAVALAKRIYMRENNCIAWSCLVLKPELQEVVEFEDLANSTGPRRYMDIAEIIEGTIQMEVLGPSADFALMDGNYLKHTSSVVANEFGHCTPLRVVAGRIFEVLPDTSGAPKTRPINREDINTAILVRLLDFNESWPSSVRFPFLETVAGGRKALSGESCLGEVALKESIQREVSEVCAKYNERGRPEDDETTDENTWPCPLCITRTYSTKRKLKAHLDKEHLKKEKKKTTGKKHLWKLGKKQRKYRIMTNSLKV